MGGGTPPPAAVALTEAWDGSSWTEIADLATARSALGGDGTAATAIVMGGGANPSPNATEEWNEAAVTSNVTVS